MKEKNYNANITQKYRVKAKVTEEKQKGGGRRKRIYRNQYINRVQLKNRENKVERLYQ